MPQIFKFFPSIILICQRGTAARHGSGRSQQRHHSQFHFSSFAILVRFQFVNGGDASQIHFSPFAIFIHFPSCLLLPPALSPFFRKTMGNFRLGSLTQTEPTTQIYLPSFRNGIYFASIIFDFFLCSQWRKEFLDGRYGSKQPTPPFTLRAPSPSFPIPVIVGRQMFPGDDGYESEDDEILLPPPPIPPQIDHPPPNVPAVRVQPMHVGQQRLPLRDLPQFEYHPQNVPAVRVQPMQQRHEPLPLRDMPQFDHPPPNVPAVHVQPMHDGPQRPPLRELPLFAGHPQNVPAVRVQPMQQPLPLRAVPQFANPPPNVLEIGVGPIHAGQQQMPLRVLPQIAHRQLNFPAIRGQPVQQPIPLRDLPQSANPPPMCRKFVRDQFMLCNSQCR
ncbi:hypothetical protein niasHT_016444 [Heterodera trifolii]|uniref:Uncharacterized protein n=1 Tax=Heterodera trifolii TaxID=157864 RepID=A0ABD2LJ41_9BILA